MELPAAHKSADAATLGIYFGRDNRPFYERQRPEPFARALRAAKAELDPDGLLNPGVLLHSEP